MSTASLCILAAFVAAALLLVASIAVERAIPLQESVDPDRIKLDPELQSREGTAERIVERARREAP